MTFKWLDLSCLCQSKPTWENRNHCKSFNIGNLIQRIWLHRWRNCWGAKGNSEAAQRFVVARGSYHPDKEQHRRCCFQSPGTRLPRGVRTMELGMTWQELDHGASAVSAGRQRKAGGHWDFPLLSPQALPPCLPKLFGSQWQENLGNGFPAVWNRVGIWGQTSWTRTLP